MKQVFLAHGKAIVKEVPQPLLDDHLVLVEVAYSFISSGTERATLQATEKNIAHRALQQGNKAIKKVLDLLKSEGLWSTISMVQSKMQQIIDVGYSCSGRVVAVGSKVTSIKVGDFVACAGAGFASHGQFVAVPELLLARLADGQHLKSASASTIGAIALQGIRRADVRLGETVCVVGLGLLGLITVQLALRAGCKVIGVDIDASKLQRARDLGAFCVVNAQHESADKELQFATQHLGADATIVTAAASNAQVLERAILATRRKGKVVIVGDVQLNVAREEFYAKELDLLISCSYGPGRYDAGYELHAQDYPYSFVRWTQQRNLQYVADLVCAGSLDIASLIAHEFGVYDAPKAYEKLNDYGVLGIVLSYQHAAEVIEKEPASTESTQVFKFPVLFARKAQETVRTAFVGLGGFAKTKLLPLVARHQNVILAGLADMHIPTVVNMASLYKVEHYSTDYRHIIADESLHAVVIATPHKWHTDQMLDVLESGKAVFVEKPLSVTFEQLERLRTFDRQVPHAPWHVDFNRRHAPFIETIKEVVMVRAAPMMISYRMNAGFIPSSHWIQSPEHGGRIIGEVCHLVHLMIYLVGALVTRIHVSVAGAGRSDMANADTVSVQLSFSDGSVSDLVYVATGNTEHDKERMEIFWEGKSIILDDYKVLQGFGLGPSFNRIVHNPDKGHEAAINYFIKGIVSGDLFKNVGERQRALYATEITLLVDALARAGGGVYDLGVSQERLAGTQVNEQVMQF